MNDDVLCEQARGGVFPAASLNVGQSARFNFGHLPWCFPPPPALAPCRSVIEAVHLGTSDAPGCTAEEG
eukprot:2839-Heterococcus_DN1.PRE.2